MRACACQRTQGQGTHAPFALFTHDLRARVCVCACVRVCMCVCARVCACARTAMFKMCMNNHHGKSFKGFSFREPGLCGDREKWTLILAIDSTGKKAFTLRKVAGTSTEDFAVFVNKILGSVACVQWVGHRAHSCGTTFARTSRHGSSTWCTMLATASCAGYPIGRRMARSNAFSTLWLKKRSWREQKRFFFGV